MVLLYFVIGFLFYALLITLGMYVQDKVKHQVQLRRTYAQGSAVAVLTFFVLSTLFILTETGRSLSMLVLEVFK